MRVRYLPLRQRRRRGTATFLIVIMVVANVIVSAAPASALSNNYILGDDELFDGRTMSADRVQDFLSRHGSYLAQYHASDRGTTKRAADIIVNVALEYNLSPKFFLTLLEKEQSLVSDPNPSANQLDYALGYGCPSSCSPAYRGFATQLHAAADRIRNSYYPSLRDQGQFNGWGPGIPKKTIDKIQVTPANIATAILYIYNPYVGKYGGGDQRWGANSLFQLLWNRWFVQQHPDGALLRVAGTPGIWLIRNGKRSAFTSRAAFVANYEMEKVIVISRDEIETYPLGPPIKFPEPSLLQVRQGGGVYLLSNGERRPIASREVLRSLGYNPEEIIRGVNASELEPYPKGATITEANVFPTGRLLKSKKTGGVVFVDSANVRHPILAREIFRSQFRGQVPQAVSDSRITALPVGDPVKFRDGELIGSRTDNHIYFVSNGTRRLIPSADIFRALGFKSKNVVWTTDRAISIQPAGEPLSDITPNGGS